MSHCGCCEYIAGSRLRGWRRDGDLLRCFWQSGYVVVEGDWNVLIDVVGRDEEKIDARDE
jgi:hypothetical protein